MATTDFLANQLAINPQALDAVRVQAKKGDTKEGVKIAARQFETYFLQMMLRSMREATPQDGIFDSQETKQFTEMFDQQLAQNISQSKGLGMADMLIAQIERNLPQNKDAIVPRPVSYDLPAVGKTPPVVLPEAVDRSVSSNFVEKFTPYATAAAKSLGVPTETLVAQAALETGWGAKELTAADGSNSYNVFNLKAGKDWIGKTVSKEVSEFFNGHWIKTTAKFRAYDSYDEAFADYAKLINSNSRYAPALNQDAAGFAAALQQGGFATDPNYSDKMMKVVNSSAFREMLKANALQQALN